MNKLGSLNSSCNQAKLYGWKPGCRDRSRFVINNTVLLKLLLLVIKKVVTLYNQNYFLWDSLKNSENLP